MRWTQTALVSSLWLSSLGCGAAAQAGLANAPALGGSLEEQGSTSDVVANGPEACRNREGAPGCEREAVASPRLTVLPAPRRRNPAAGLDWMKLRYRDWPCEPLTEIPLGRILVAQSAAPAVAGLCSPR